MIGVRRSVRDGLVWLALALAPAGAGAANPVEDLLESLRSIQSEARVPAVGLVLMVDRRPRRVAAWGRTGNPRRPQADADTPFRLGSITKTFTALTAMALVERGALGLAEPLGPRVAGQVDNPWAATHPLRLVHLLELTAGLSDLSPLEWADPDPSPLSLGAALALNPTERRALWPPGTRYSYSNAPAGLTALAIEQRTGETFEAAARRLVLEPLAMPTATFLHDDYLEDNLPRGFQADGTTVIPYWHMTYRAFGALSATPSEMSHFLTALLNDGQFAGTQAIGHRTLESMFVPRSTLAAASGLAIGYGLGIYGKVRRGFVFYGHGGDADGFRSRYGILPDAGRGYFVVINADNPGALERMRRAIERHLTDDLDAPTPPPPLRLPPARLDTLLGQYYPSSIRFRVDAWRAGQLPCARISATLRGLRFNHGKRSVALLPVSEALFRRPRDPLATVAFIEDSGAVHLQGELGNFIRVEPTTPPPPRPETGAFIARCDSQ